MTRLFTKNFKGSTDTLFLKSLAGPNSALKKEQEDEVRIGANRFTGISSQIRTKLRGWAVWAGNGRLLLSGSIVLK